MFMALHICNAHVEDNCVIGPMSLGYKAGNWGLQSDPHDKNS
jgi:hypothetical protein